MGEVAPPGAGEGPFFRPDISFSGPSHGAARRPLASLSLTQLRWVAESARRSLDSDSPARSASELSASLRERVKIARLASPGCHPERSEGSLNESRLLKNSRRLRSTSIRRDQSAGRMTCAIRFTRCARPCALESNPRMRVNLSYGLISPKNNQGRR
jgi:hypothetical protein